MSEEERQVLYHRHPSQRYIMYLLTQGDPSRCSNTFVLRELKRFGLPPAGDSYIDTLRDELLADLPKPFLPADPTARKTRAYLKRHRIYSLHHPNRMVLESHAILTDFVIRRPVEMGLLGNVPYKRIAREIKKKHQVDITEGGVEAYAHYYFDVRALSLEEWSGVLAETPMPVAVRDQQMGSLVCGGQVALHRMGIKTQMESATILRDLQRRIYVNAKEVDERLPISRDKVSMLVSLTGAALAVHKQVTTSDAEIRALLRDLERLRMDTDDEPVVPMSTVVDTEAGGTYSDTSDVLEGNPDDVDD